jgi:membrane associated rhomboid family serine protease
VDDRHRLTAAGERGDGVLVVAALLAVMWVSEAVDLLPGVDLDRFGIEPREAGGLDGIVLAPFLHDGFAHLLANTLPFAVLGALIALAGAARVLAVTAIVALASGLGTWLLGGENTVHIGASGVVFGYATYLMARGFMSRRPLQIAIGVAIAAVWGTAFLGGLLPHPGISWQAHAFGAVGGIAAAWALDHRRPREQAATVPI